MYGQPHREDVRLALDRDELLGEHVLGGRLVDRLDLAGLHRRDAVGRLPAVEDLAAGLHRHAVEPGLHPDERGAVTCGPLPLALLEHRHRPGGAEGVVVEGGLDLEDLDVAVAEHLAHAPVRAVELALVAVHEAAGALHRLHVVVVPQRPVRGQAGGGGLPAAVHRHEVDVHVDDQVAGGRPLVDLHLLALARLADERHAVGILGVVVVEEAVGREGVVHAVADGVAQLGLGHAAVQGQRRDEVHVVDPGRRGQVEHGLDHPLPHVGPAHRGQRQADVVEGDGELHARLEQRAQRGRVAERVVQRVADGGVGIVERRERLAWVEHAGAAGGQLLEPEPLAVVEEDRWGRAVDLEDEPGRGIRRCLSLVPTGGRRRS